MSRSKYEGIIPAFYACYDETGKISTQGVRELTKHFIKKGVQGVYVNGSSGECIYQSKEERKEVLEAVMEEARGKLTVIAHVACNNTQDSVELAAHAQALGVDAIAAIPPIYFKLPEQDIAKYWNDISAGAPETDFIIYNIPSLAGVELTIPLFEKMLKNPKVVGVKNSSMPIQDIEMFKNHSVEDFIVFNGPDEQLAGGLAVGADGGIGGTYGVMPEVYLKIYESIKSGDIKTAQYLQRKAVDIIGEMVKCKGNLYAVMKEIIRIRENLDLGGVRAPLRNIEVEDQEQIKKCISKIDGLLASIK